MFRSRKLALSSSGSGADATSALSSDRDEAAPPAPSTINAGARTENAALCAHSAAKRATRSMVRVAGVRGSGEACKRQSRHA
eukprot:scaffold466_cov238-Pinguiococcus_pyrenoidosus.AAC.7